MLKANRLGISYSYSWYFIIFLIFLFSCSFIYWSSLIPYPLYCGSILTIISVDNGNIGFILLSIILFPFIDWIAGFESKTMNISFLLFYLFFGLILCFLLISLLLFFICYECLILLLFFILFLFIPTYYRIRTAFFFFLFSIFFSLLLVFNVGWLIRWLHCLGASLFMLFILIHWIRGAWIRLKVIELCLWLV